VPSESCGEGWVTTSGPGRNGIWQTLRVTDARDIRYARSGEVQIAYQVLGQSRPDLLLFFAINASIDSMDEEPALHRFHDRLASFSRLIRFDCRGVGLSDPLAANATTAMEQWVDDALGVLDAEGIASTTVLADMRAAPKAIMMAAAHPDRVSRLVIVNGTARVAAAPDYPFGVPPEAIDRFAEEVTDPSAMQHGLDDLALFAPSAQDDLAFRSWWVRAGRRGASPSTARSLLQMDNFADVRELLPLIRVPMLVLHRRGARTIRAAHGRYLAEHVAGATYVELEGEDSLCWVGETDEMLTRIEEFLTGSSHPPEPDRVLATVLFSDIVDSTSQASAMGDRAWRDRLDSHDAMVRRQLSRFRGNEVKTTGDGFLASFDGPNRAIQCACAMIDGAQQLGLQVRAGLHTGEVEVRGEDIAGIAVHIGARVAALAGASEVLVSRTVTDLVAGAGTVFADRGEHTLKGVPGSWQLFAVDR